MNKYGDALLSLFRFRIEGLSDKAVINPDSNSEKTCEKRYGAQGCEFCCVNNK
jgi:hypothetical protein